MTIGSVMQVNRTPFRLGVDIGSTFTDVVLEGQDGVHSLKVLMVPKAPEDAIIAGIGKLCAAVGIQPGQVGRIIHGTTLATNALIERRGTRTALVTTKISLAAARDASGFRAMRDK